MFGGAEAYFSIYFFILVSISYRKKEPCSLFVRSLEMGSLQAIYCKQYTDLLVYSVADIFFLGRSASLDANICIFSKYSSSPRPSGDQVYMVGVNLDLPPKSYMV